MPSPRPSPTATAFIAAVNAPVNSGRIRRSTRNRLGEVQTCPALATLAATQALTAAATSVSAHTMTGACSPSSIVLAFMAAAASPATCLPTGTEPVNATYRITGEAMTCREISSGIPNRTFSTPGGSPASANARAIRQVVHGVSSDGLITMGQPAASAAAILRIGPPAGKFHGTNAPTGPTGKVRTDSTWPGSDGMIRP
jgi:hypothetical protein